MMRRQVRVRPSPRRVRRQEERPVQRRGGQDSVSHEPVLVAFARYDCSPDLSHVLYREREETRLGLASASFTDAVLK